MTIGEDSLEAQNNFILEQPTIVSPLSFHSQTAVLDAAKLRIAAARYYQGQFNLLSNDDFDNLRRCYNWLSTQNCTDTANLLYDYLVVLADCLFQKGLNTELLHWCQKGICACEQLQKNPGEAFLLQGNAQSALGQWRSAISSYHAAITKTQNMDEMTTYAQAVFALGRLQLHQGSYQRALKTLREAERLFGQLSDYERLAAVHAEKAAYYLNRGEIDKALLLYLQADGIHKQAGKTPSSMNIQLMLGVIYRRKKDYKQAIRYLQELYLDSEIRSDQNAMATATHHLAWVCWEQGDIETAHNLAGKAMALYTQSGDSRGYSDAQEQLGCIAFSRGQIQEAIAYFQDSLDARRVIGNQHGVASNLRRLAIARFRLKHYGPATWYLWQSFILYSRMRMFSCQRFITIFQRLVTKKGLMS